MSQTKDLFRWQLPSSIKLRKGQERVLNLLDDPQSGPRQARLLAAELPTGYGKTFVICAAYALLKSQGVVNRALIVVPSDEQLQSYLGEIEEDMAQIGAPITAALQANSNLALRSHRRNEAEIFVTTVQALGNGSIATISDLLTSGKWFLALDEYHRYAKNNSWGKSIASVRGSAVFELAVSATPNRTDQAEKVVDGEPDVRVSLVDAVEEGAIRPVVVRSSEYALDISFGKENSPQRFTTSDLVKELQADGKDISGAEVKRDLRYLPKYLHRALLDASGKLDELNAENQGQHKMLVFALGVGHAKSVCDQMNDIAGAKVADWIGVQSTVVRDDGTKKVIGRSESENRSVLQRFKDGQFNVLVQVKKATEGFNDVKCSVLLFLNLVNESVQLKQMIGRGLRRNYALEPATGARARKDKCWIFVSDDHPGLDYMKSLADNTLLPEDDEEQFNDTERNSSGVPIYNIPDFFILNAQYTGEEFYYPVGGEMISASEARAKARTNLDALRNASDDEIDARLRKIFDVEPKRVSTTEQLKETRGKVAEAVRSLAKNVARIKAEAAGGTAVKSIIGDLHKAIHSRWVRETGLSTDEMNIEELIRKYEWVKSINDELKSASNPLDHIRFNFPWLNL